MTEEKPTVWNEIYTLTDSNSIMHIYYDNGYIVDYDLNNDKELGERKMTAEDYEFLNNELYSIHKAFDRAYEGMKKMAKEEEQTKYDD